jgi:uncharacterized membrane protein
LTDFRSAPVTASELVAITESETIRLRRLIQRSISRTAEKSRSVSAKIACETEYEGSSPMAKTLTFACVHFTVAFTVTYALTGSILLGGLIALIEPLCNTVAYYVHEKAWDRWGGVASARVDVCAPAAPSRA